MEERIKPNWDEYFMSIAYIAATRSSCKHLQTGAVVVIDKRLVGTGYNGAPPGITSCLEKGCRKDEYKIDFDDKGKGVCKGTHAEINAINQVARKDLKGSTLYSLYFPCSACAKAIVGDNIEKVIYCKVYKEIDSLTNELFSESGIKLVQMNLNLEKIIKSLNQVARR